MTDLSYTDRLLLAKTWLRMQYERRGSFLSDSDVLDAADFYTIDEIGADEMPDYEELREDLFAYLAFTEF